MMEDFFVCHKKEQISLLFFVCNRTLKRLYLQRHDDVAILVVIVFFRHSHDAYWRKRSFKIHADVFVFDGSECFEQIG